jgi:hypothetical protein
MPIKTDAANLSFADGLRQYRRARGWSWVNLPKALGVGRCDSARNDERARKIGAGKTAWLRRSYEKGVDISITIHYFEGRLAQRRQCDRFGGTR